MVALTKSVSDLSKSLYARMTDFEKDLKKYPNTSSDTNQGITVEFSAFRLFAMQTLTMLQQQVNFLAQTIDTMEMRGRRKILLLHGVPETKEEDTTGVVVRVVKEHLKLDLEVPDIKRCHRMGRSTQKPRPILFKLHNTALPDGIWFGKTSLKGTGKTISEFLTKTRHNFSSVIYVLDGQGSWHQVSSLVDLDDIGVPSEASQLMQGRPEQRVKQPGVAAAAVAKVIAPKTKRVARR
ncbi:hypothetical protein HW555_001155 [Spodoptera exigua]|uniref:Uncharacterized protein n=1 Tax=Spodoptera exigua TaxID=7107 RepID=A0A835GUX7_SPOEX|nr:hypothetical protein HW555_001155 [Spodoptera exigua]